MIIHERIRQLRQEQHLSQAAFAERIAYSTHSVMEWEKEQTRRVRLLCLISPTLLMFLWTGCLAAPMKDRVCSNLPLNQAPKPVKLGLIHELFTTSQGGS